MKKPLPQAGFALMEALMIIIALGLVGAAGYTVYQNRQAAVNTFENFTHSDTPAAPAITTEADLTAAATVMDSINLDTSHTADVNAIEANTKSFE